MPYTTWEPRKTPVGYMTQVIGNRYPYWHAARKKVGGKTQRVINSLAGFPLTELQHKIRRFRSNLFLRHVDLSEPSQIWTCPRPELSETTRNPYNLLQNPSLSRIQPYRLGPWGWNEDFLTATGSYEVRHGTGLYGYYAIRLTAASGETISLKQTVNLIFRRNEPYTATVWYAGIRPNRALASRTSGPYLKMTTVYSDNTSSIATVYLEDDTDGSWKKASVSSTPHKDTFSVTVEVVCDDYSGDTVVLDIGGLQLERGLSSSPWSDYIFTTGSYCLVSPKESITETTAWGDITYNRQTRRRLDTNLTYDELVYSIPDRCTKTLATGQQALSRNMLDMYVEEDGMRFNIGWRIATNRIEKFNADIGMDEVFGTYDIADLYAAGDITEELYYKPSELSVTQTLEAITTSADYIIVVVKEVYLGNTYRVIKFVSPYTMWDETYEHLECLGEVYLDNGANTCTAIGLIDSRSDKLLVTINGIDYVVDMIWDKAARNDNGIIIMRSDPEDGYMVA